MFSEQHDQAAGLRRLLVRNQTRIITVVGGKSGVGRTCNVINLADSLARCGKNVLVLDENFGSNNLIRSLALPARYDLMDIAHGRCQPQQALLSCNDFQVLSTARAMRHLHEFDQLELIRLENALTQLSQHQDVMLVDATMRIRQSAVASSMANSSELLVVIDPTVTGITESYALIKRLALQNRRMQFQIVVNRAASERVAQTVFNNMASVARHNLGAKLHYLGFIQLDNHQKQASLLQQSLMEICPTAPAGKDYMALSARLLSLPDAQAQPAADISQIMKNLMQQMQQTQEYAVTTNV